MNLELVPLIPFHMVRGDSTEVCEFMDVGHLNSFPKNIPDTASPFNKEKRKLNVLTLNLVHNVLCSYLFHLLLSNENLFTHLIS